MIVPSMSVQEIHKEVFEDIKNLETKLDECRNDFKKTVLKSSRYPLTKSYDCKTREKRNLFIVDFTAMKRSDWKKPILSIYGIYSRPEGKYAVVPTVEMNIISIHPPHFFKRYRERIVKDASISNEDIIRQYFKKDWGFMGVVVNEEFESVYHCFESNQENDKISFVAATSQGYCFGEKQGNINIIKTIISEDMLFENQKKVFNALKEEFNAFNKERYGTNI
ncbi:hypothetical protein [uncultured Dysgonomonas sp.]|uniref:hypothetical protein n=1 Tax=uncultured Dysgonomonas sp. TaxID=206096 RepID=UPI000AE42B96|nr:hypothetical protein [uncultured Dysgonomonas sp.]